jgi:Asp-tRNA(Asn)/Glu-tRNA(Gln) amidotransferase A subunit family amidase
LRERIIVAKWSRRVFTQAAIALASGVGARALLAAPAPGASSLVDLSAADAVRHMSRGDFTVESYAQALIEQCRRAASLNAFISFDADRVLEEARRKDRARRKGGFLGPLFGLPIPVKDSVNTQDFPTTGGTPALRTFRPRYDAPLVAQLKSAGAIVLGKTNLHELSYGWTSNNLAFGPVRNPYDRQRIPGGSSGGTAAAISAHLAPLGVAEDTEGSIRVPAAFCGVMGFRPTTGRYPTQGCVPVTTKFDQLGPQARTVADLVLFDSVIVREPQPVAARPLTGVRLGIVRDYFFTNLDPEVARLTQRALSRLTEAGASIVEGSLPDLARLIDLTTAIISNHEVVGELTRYLKTYHTGIDLEQLVRSSSPDIRDYFTDWIMPGGKHVASPREYAAARDRYLPAVRRLYREHFATQRIDALVFPTTRIPAPRIGDEGDFNIAGRAVSFDVAVGQNIAPGSTAGVPGLVIPVGLTHAGLPISLEFDAPAASDRALLALGLSIERVVDPTPPPTDFVGTAA